MRPAIPLLALLPRKTAGRSTGHYMVKSKTLGIWICVADHQCGEVRDRHGRPLTA